MAVSYFYKLLRNTRKTDSLRRPGLACSSPIWRRGFAAFALLGAVALSGTLLGADKQLSVNYNIPLWEEGKVPMANGTGLLDAPFLTVFLPPDGKNNGGSVVVAPGGGNIMLMYGGEGIDIAERYNEWGVVAFVLTYRMSPPYNDKARTLDGKRAIQVVRAHASEWKLDPNRVGFIGFSAGSTLGHLVGAASGPGDPNSADPVERFSSRPDYLGLVYGPGRVQPGESLKDFPPTFLLVAAADRGNAIGSAQLFTELTKAGATAELHIYQKGRHGFGSGYASGNLSDWMPRLEHFLQQDGFIPGGK
jgi:acetyl esterase/lipase